MSPFLSACPPQEPSPKTRKKFGCFSSRAPNFVLGSLNRFIFPVPVQVTARPVYSCGLVLIVVVSLMDRQMDEDTRRRLKRLVIVRPSLWIPERITRPDKIWLLREDGAKGSSKMSSIIRCCLSSAHLLWVTPVHHYRLASLIWGFLSLHM